MKKPQFSSAVLVTILLLGSGCGGTSGPARTPVHGKVTVKGKPVPGGAVMIRPAEGSSGVAGSTPIIDGEYHFTSENGPQAGKYVLVVNLADVAAPKGGGKGGPKPGGGKSAPTETIELPGEIAEFKFEIEVPPEGELVKDVDIN